MPSLLSLAISGLTLLGEPGGDGSDFTLTLSFGRPLSLGASFLAQEPTKARQGWVAARGGVGFTIDPDTFLMAGEVGMFLTGNFSLGPLLQLGVSDQNVIIAPTLNAQWMFDLPERKLAHVKPFVQGGLGLAYVKEDDRRGEDDDVGFLMNFGFGAEFYLTDRGSVGSNVLFNFMPDKVLDENFFFSWQLVTFRYMF